MIIDANAFLGLTFAIHLEELAVLCLVLLT